jgi:predicted RNase H-like HicB family nuclease
LQGLVAEGNTVEEAVGIAEDLAHLLLELDLDKAEALRDRNKENE